jgi:hypothetical protein
MKKSFLYVMALLVGFSACRKEDKPLFEESADERAVEATAAYKSQLTGATNGWKVMVYPAGGGAYSFYMKFTDQDRVSMLSDFDSTSAVDFMESSYRVKALQQPTLVFDTYSYIHRLADPNPNVSGGPLGEGLRSDFEFSIDSASADTIRLTGRFNGSEAVMMRATAAEALAFNNKQLANAMLFSNVSKIVNYFKRLTIGTTLYDVSINTTNRTLTFSWLDGSGNVQSTTTSYYYTFSGVQLVQPIPYGTGTITGFTNITFDAATVTIGVTAGTTTGSIVGVGKPLKVDLTGPARWWQRSVDQGTYWISFDGFTVNGVPDAFGVTKMPNFYFLLYRARYGFSGPVNYDLLGFVKVVNGAPTISYGPAYHPPTFTTDGRIIFSILGVLGTVPSSDSIPHRNTRIQMVEPNGYYLIQKSTDVFDMVSAKDGKAWITWEW